MRDSKDTYFIKMLELVAARSTCARRSVGAIITDVNGYVLATGYNGTPVGFEHCVRGGDYLCPGADDRTGDSRRCLAVHAEQSALLQCHRGDLMHNLYVSCAPCFTCAKLILNTPIRRVVAVEAYSESDGAELLAKMEKLYLYNHDTGAADLYGA